MNAAHHAVAPEHGAARLVDVIVLSHSLKLRDSNSEFIGDRANDRALYKVLDRLRAEMRAGGGDPFGDLPTSKLSKERLDNELQNGMPTTEALLRKAIEEFADHLAGVVRAFRVIPVWQRIERLAVGGGFSGSGFGRCVIERAGEMLADSFVRLAPIHHPPDEAGLIGAARLAGQWNDDWNSMLSVDLGGTKMRVGLLDVQPTDDSARLRVRVVKRNVWRHRSDRASREAIVTRLCEMLNDLAAAAVVQGRRLSPIIGIGCPGEIAPDGHILSGAHNLPGDWEEPGFNLADRIAAGVTGLGEPRARPVLHNDAVTQGLSETPFLANVNAWGIFTIGTGLGNACFQRL